MRARPTDCETCRVGQQLEPGRFPTCSTCGGTGQVEIEPDNERALVVLLTAAPSWGWGFNLQAIYDAEEMLDVTLMRTEIMRVHRAWTTTQPKPPGGGGHG